MALTGPSAATAATSTFTPSADAHVFADTPSTNYGSDTTLRVDGSPIRRAYLRFDVALPAGAVVTRTTLRLYFTESSSSGYSVSVASSNSWSEGAITYDNAPSFGGTVGSASSTVTGWNSVTVPNVGTGQTTYVVSRASDTSKSAHSRENTNKPQLVVEYGGTTEPPPPPATTNPVIAAAGDIACSPSDSNYKSGAGTSTACRQKYTSDLLVNAGLAAVLPLGDLQYNGGALSDFRAVYDPTWGRVKSITRPVLGNHEGTGTGYFDYFNGSGVTSGRAGDRGKGYYSFDVGSWHLIALNSNCSRVSCSPGSAQETWLRADLGAHPASCTLAYWHHPRFSSGYDGDGTFMQPLWQALYDAGAELALVGHSHDYERFAPQDAAGKANSLQGIRQFVVGTGGAFFTGLGTAKPNSEVRQNNTYGVLNLTLKPTGYDWRFLAESGKLFSDSGSGTCHGTPGGTLPPPPPPSGGTVFSPEADAPVQESSPASNYATSALRTDGGSDPDVESYLRFTTSNLTGTVQSAKLRLFATSGTADGPAVYSTGNAWTETGITWNNRPARTSAARDDKGSIGSGTWVEYDVTPFVTGNGTFSFTLATTSSDGVDFYSREGTTKPQLVVTTG